MKKYYIVLIILSYTLSCAELFAEERARGNHVLVIKTGSFKLNNANQNSLRTLTTQSEKVFGVEYEWHMWKGLSIGGELFHYENNFTTPSKTKTFTAKVSSILFNVKYHFNDNGAFQPFVGLGYGNAFVPYTGDGYSFGGHSGTAHQFSAGLTYRFKYVGVYAEYKLFNSKPEVNLSNTSNDKYDVGGKGLLIGVSVLF